MLRIGLLGASRIAVPAILVPAKKLDGVTVSEVAARDVSRSRDYAAQHGIGSVQPDYEALIHSPDNDLIYNGLPPSEHASFTIAAIEAGKHVLCEKPFAMSSEEAGAMLSAARHHDRILIEAFHYRFHPLFKRVLAMIAAGDIGNVEAIAAHFSVPIKNSGDEFRYRPEFGGGALMDLGCYAVHWARSIVGDEPIINRASQKFHASGVDVETAATLQFPKGQMARITCAMNEDLPGFDASLSIVGSRGRIDVQNPAVPQNGNRVTLTNDDGLEGAEIDGESTFYYQLEHVRDLIKGTCSPILRPDDALENMRAIESIVKVARDSDNP